MIEYEQTENGRLESLAGYSWVEIRQHMTLYACEHGLTDLYAVNQPTEQAQTAAEILEVMRMLENSVTFYELPQALGYLYAKYDFYCHFFEFGMLQGVFKADGPFSGRYEAARVLLEKIVPANFGLIVEKALYNRLQEHRRCTSSDNLLAMGIYTQAFSLMAHGKSRPRRRKSVESRAVLHLCYNNLDKILTLKPTPGLERVESQKRDAWFTVLACCFPTRFFQEMRYSQKSA